MKLPEVDHHRDGRGHIRDFCEICVLPSHEVVYLLHFTTPVAHARHYLGHAVDLRQRLLDQVRGKGAKLVARAVEAGSEIVLVRWWPGDKSLESTFKHHGGSSPRSRNGRHGASTGLSRYCHLCNKYAHNNRQSPKGWAGVLWLDEIVEARKRSAAAVVRINSCN